MLVLSAWSMGCAATSDYMKPVVTPTARTAPADKALVWIARPSNMANRVIFQVMDEKGKFIGDAVPGSRFAVLMDPGEHMLIVWSESQEALKGTFAAGKTYYVQVNAKMGAWKARASLYAVKKGTDLWKEKDSWKDLPVLEVDTAKGQAYFDSIKVDVDDALLNGKKQFEGYSAEDKKDVVLVAEDGE